MDGTAFFLLRLNDHIQYLRKIQATLDGKGDFRGTDFHACKLGTWLYGAGPAEAAAAGPEAAALFDSLIEPHQRFHQASHEAIARQEAGDPAGSRAAVTEMMTLSATLVDTLLALDKAAKG
ncbi:CZB domain-containing protein [Thiocystis violacea]|uniref:CZB domain-containing protein n=1 Tax=Thiocystis violacea TaxID=13725 RepID=UPI001904ED7C|nr:CZB domain-containing protein [Thiocystis violacea]MBK1724610.1 hypothetical protein [Thiocystis violacea]